MWKLSPFRVSFDGPLGSGERMRARIAATLVGGTAIIVGATGALALLNAGSSTIGDWTNARPTPEVQLTAGDRAGSSNTKAAAVLETTGAAPAADIDEAPGAIPIPVPAPKASASSAPPRLSKRVEQGRAERGRRKLRAQRMRARAEARRAKREQILRRWAESTGPFGGSRRDVVIGRGSPDDDFFRTMR